LNPRAALHEELRLFPRREVTTFVELVVMDEFGVRPLCPIPRALIELIMKKRSTATGTETPLGLKYASLFSQ